MTKIKDRWRNLNKKQRDLFKKNTYLTNLISKTSFFNQLATYKYTDAFKREYINEWVCPSFDHNKNN